MYVVSPHYVVNSYRTTDDYYKVSAIQRNSAASRISTRRQPTEPPFQGSASKLANGLKQSFSSLDQLPAASVSELGGSPVKPYGPYRSPMQAYQPVPMTGLLLDLTI